MGTKEVKTRNKGVTLISLVVTIIVLLILAGVTIAALSGDNGILQNAGKAKEESEQASDIEKIKIAMSEAQIGERGYQNLDQSNLQEAINKQFGDENIKVLEKAEGQFIVILDSKIYKISSNEISEVQVDLYINNKEELKEFRDNVNNGNTYEGKYILLTSDITLDIDQEWIPIGLYANESSKPSDERNKYFAGIFDGGNHYIKNIFINNSNKAQGMFGLNNGGVICNLRVIDCDITGGISTGGIVGYNYNNSTIYNCLVNGKIKNPQNRIVGGIAGVNSTNSNIVNSLNDASIDGNTVVGGVVGYQEVNSYINSCCNNKKIISEGSIVGGICGQSNDKSMINNCYNVGEVEGNLSVIGGIVGNNTNSIIKNSYNISNINCSEEYMNWTGYISGTNYSGGEIKDSCYIVKNSKINAIGNTDNSCISTDIYIIDEENQQKMLSIINKDNAYKEDINNINNGYPILIWQ